MDIVFWILTALAGLLALFLLVLLSWQFIFVFFGVRKPKSFPESDKLKRLAIIIPAHNESSVIYDSVHYLLHDMEYPADLYDVYVCADNCTDDTADLAKKAGAKVYVRTCDDPTKKRAAFPIKLLIDEIMASGIPYDAVIKFDADNKPRPDFFKRMSDALNAGVEIARAHEAPSNMGQNLWTSVSSCYYARDSRLACSFRQRHHMNSMISGAGMMVSMQTLFAIGGWDAMSGIDDAEFAVLRMLEGRHIDYVPDAIVYEDQPSSKEDTAARNSRMSNALGKLYWEKGGKLLGKFFKTAKLTYFDMWCQLSFVPLPMILGIGLGIYFGFYFLTLSLQAGGIPVYSEALFTAGIEGSAFFTMMVTLIAGAGAFLFYYVFWTYQSWLGVFLDREILGPTWYKEAKKGIWLGAFAMFAYGSSVSKGVAKKNVKWKEIKRNTPNK